LCATQEPRNTKEYVYYDEVGSNAILSSVTGLTSYNDEESVVSKHVISENILE